MTEDFDPPNSFRYERIEYHGKPAIRVKSSRGRTLDFTYMHEPGETPDAALERVRRSCAESDRCAAQAVLPVVKNKAGWKF